MDGYYFKARGHGSGAYPPRNIQEQVDAIMLRLAGEPEPESAPDDGMSHGYAPPPPPRNWRDTADSIVAQLEREQAERADTGDGAGDGGWPMTGYAESTQAEPPPASPSYGSAAYDWLRQEAYLQANKIGDDLGRYYRDVTTDPLGAIYAAAPSFGPFGAEAGQLLGAVGRSANYLSALGPYLRDQRILRSVEGGPVHRVWGDKSEPWGRSWTAVNPGSVADYRSVAGLPDVNTGRFVSEGILNSIEGVLPRPAPRISLWQRGGLPELVIENPQSNVTLTRVSGANPEF